MVIRQMLVTVVKLVFSAELHPFTWFVLKNRAFVLLMNKSSLLEQVNEK